MKAVCLLLCLGLARNIAGSIFERRIPTLERLGERIGERISEPLEKLGNVKQHLLNHQRSQEALPTLKNQQLGQYPQQHQQQFVARVPLEMQQNQFSYENLFPRQSYLQKGRVQRESSKLHSSENDDSLQTNQLHSSAESSQERQEEMDLPPVFADENMPTQMIKLQEAAHGDAIEWRGIKIAVGPNSLIQKKEDIAKLYADAQKSMKHINEESQKNFHNTYQVASQKDNEDIYLNATQLLKKNGYPVEEHIIQTEDGYLLTMFRIVKQATRHSRSVASKGAVLLMHGLYGSADDWLLMGPKHSLAYLLADEGYDVLLGNVRGNKYCRNHVIKHPAQKDFWQFSTDEIARVDLPALIDYALKITGQQKLFYVGYSQGTTAFFAMASAMPEYNEKIIKMYAIAPMVYMSNARSPMVRMIAPSSDLFEQLKPHLKDGEFKPSKELLKTMGGDMCEQEIGCKKICSNLNFVMSGVNLDNLEPEQIPVIMGHLPAGGSTRQIKQLGQALASNEFRMYDYGSEVNQKMYGTVQPPVYDVSQIQTPVALYYSEEDWLSHPKDVERLHRELPNVTEHYKVPEAHFSHMDYQFYKNAPQVVYHKLIKSMNNSS
ncbi:lipase 3-like [Achroia grisella]|uniref:lipase 3-like n=1 Tax=Achroia grisella TaxID=688607 RepID=UPI0027D1FA56|nr:lipase 3-like [Achroia grisella]